MFMPAGSVIPRNKEVAALQEQQQRPQLFLLQLRTSESCHCRDQTQLQVAQMKLAPKASPHFSEGYSEKKKRLMLPEQARTTLPSTSNSNTGSAEVQPERVGSNTCPSTRSRHNSNILLGCVTRS